MKIQYQKLREDAKCPFQASERSAGADLYACLEGEICRIPPHGTVMIGTGIAAAFPEGYFGAVFARSGLAAKQSLRPANCVGVIDSDYRGEIIVALHNDSEEERCIAKGERIAQLVLLPCMQMEFEQTDELDKTGRGSGGFGHTGTR